jgi:hypothetical protein
MEFVPKGQVKILPVDEGLCITSFSNNNLYIDVGVITFRSVLSCCRHRTVANCILQTANNKY